MDNQQPTAYYTSETGFKSKKPWFFSRKVLYLILAVVFAAEVILGIKNLIAPLPKSQYQKLQPISGAQISLLAPGNFKVKEAIPVVVRLSTGGQTVNGTDLVLKYDSRLLEASPGAFLKGKIYQDYPLISVDPKAGVIKVSGVFSVGQNGFNGVNTFGVVVFKAKAVGEANVTVDFKKGTTDKSTVIESSTNQNILEQVSDLKITIK